MDYISDKTEFNPNSEAGLLWYFSKAHISEEGLRILQETFRYKKYFCAEIDSILQLRKLEEEAKKNDPT